MSKTPITSWKLLLPKNFFKLLQYFARWYRYRLKYAYIFASGRIDSRVAMRVEELGISLDSFISRVKGGITAPHVISAILVVVLGVGFFIIPLSFFYSALTAAKVVGAARTSTDAGLGSIQNVIYGEDPLLVVVVGFVLLVALVAAALFFFKRRK